MKKSYKTKEQKTIEATNIALKLAEKTA